LFFVSPFFIHTYTFVHLRRPSSFHFCITLHVHNIGIRITNVCRYFRLLQGRWSKHGYWPEHCREKHGLSMLPCCGRQCCCWNRCRRRIHAIPLRVSWRTELQTASADRPDRGANKAKNDAASSSSCCCFGRWIELVQLVFNRSEDSGRRHRRPPPAAVCEPTTKQPDSAHLG